MKDILLDSNTLDVRLESRGNHSYYEASWVSSSDFRYQLVKVTIPSYISENAVRAEGIYIKLPYKPTYKPIKLCVQKLIGDSVIFIRSNTPDGYYDVKAKLYGQSSKAIMASELLLISEDGCYIAFDENGTDAFIYSADSIDLVLGDCESQNKACLVQCTLGSNYRYPLTGVGISKYFNMPGLSISDVNYIKNQFAADGVTIEDVSYNPDTNEFLIK